MILTGNNIGNPRLTQNSENNRICMDSIDLFEVLSHRFTKWEVDFASSLKTQHENGGISCSLKQANVAKKIIDSINSKILMEQGK